jgi:hypothetical protein
VPSGACDRLCLATFDQFFFASVHSTIRSEAGVVVMLDARQLVDLLGRMTVGFKDVPRRTSIRLFERTSARRNWSVVSIHLPADFRSAWDQAEEHLAVAYPQVDWSGVQPRLGDGRRVVSIYLSSLLETA